MTASAAASMVIPDYYDVSEWGFEKVNLWDTDHSNRLSLYWGEDDTAERLFTFNVNEGNRTLDMSGDLTVEADSIINQDLTTDSTVAQFATLTLTTLQDLLDGDLAININTLNVTAKMNAVFNIDNQNTEGKYFLVQKSGVPLFKVTTAEGATPARTDLWQLLDMNTYAIQNATGLISQWTNDSGYVTGGPYLALSGGTMAGNIAMGNNDISGVDRITATEGVFGTLLSGSGTIDIDADIEFQAGHQIVTTVDNHLYIGNSTRGWIDLLSSGGNNYIENFSANKAASQNLYLTGRFGVNMTGLYLYADTSFFQGHASILNGKYVGITSGTRHVYNTASLQEYVGADVIGTWSAAGLAIGALALTVDTDTLVVNAAGYEDRVGIGTATPDEGLTLGSASAGLNERIYSTLGASIVTAGTAWTTTGAGFTASGTDVEFNGTGLATAYCTPSLAPTIGVTYLVTFTYTYTSGTGAYFGFGGAIYSANTYLGGPTRNLSFYCRAASNANLVFTQSAGSTGVWAVTNINIQPLTNGSLTVNKDLIVIGGRLGVGTATPAYLFDVYVNSPVGNIFRCQNTDTIYGGGFILSINNGRGLLAFTNAAGIIDYEIKNTTGGWRVTKPTNIYGGSSIGETYAATAPPTNGLIVQGNVGFGVTSPSAKLHVLATTEQLRLGYDVSNYASFTVGSTGLLTMDAVGAGAGFAFSDGVYLDNLYEKTVSARIGINNILLCKHAIYLTQTDGNEYIDSLNDGYVDIGATTAIRLNSTDVTLADGCGLNVYEDITYLGATGENLLVIPDDKADAFSIQEGANKYMTFCTTDAGEKVTLLKDTYFSSGYIFFKAGLFYDDNSGTMALLNFDKVTPYALDCGALDATSYAVGGVAGASGTFQDKDSNTVTVTNGLITALT